MAWSELKGNEKALDQVGDEFNEAEKQADQFGDELARAAKDADSARASSKNSIRRQRHRRWDGAAFAAVGTAAVGAGKPWSICQRRQPPLPMR